MDTKTKRGPECRVYVRTLRVSIVPQASVSGAEEELCHGLGVSLSTGLALAAFLGPHEGSPGWLQWGGPDRDFHSPETGLLEVWPEAGPELLWVTELEGKTTVREIWLNRRVRFFHTSSLRIESHIYASSGTGSPTYLVPLSSFQPLEKTAWAAPTLADGRLYLRDQTQVMAFDIRREAS